MVAADDQVGAAIVLADDRVPDRLARAGHAHRQRQQAEGGRLLGIVADQLLVAAHAGEMVDVAGLGHADHGMDQQVGLGRLGGAVGQLLVGAVHRVAGLEGDHPAPAQLAEPVAQLLRRVAQMLEIVVHGRLDALHSAAQIDGAGMVVQVAHRRMSLVVGAEHRHRLGPLVGLPAIGDRERGVQHALAVAQVDGLADLDLLGEGGGHVEGDRYRPQDTVGEAQVGEHRLVVGPTHEALERRESAIHQELEIAELAIGQVPGLAPGRSALGHLGRRGVEVEIAQLATVRVLESAHATRLLEEF